MITFSNCVLPCQFFAFASLNLREFRFAQTMTFAIEEINNSSSLLPNVTVGYEIYDSCSTTLVSMRAAMSLVNGQEQTAQQCSGKAPVHAIIGESESSSTIAIARITGPFHIPVVTCLHLIIKYIETLEKSFNQNSLVLNRCRSVTLPPVRV